MGRAYRQFAFEVPSEYSQVVFSPDGRWLGVNDASRYRFYRTGSWKPGPEIDYGTHQGSMRMAFHPNSRIAALADMSQSVVKLVDVASGRVLTTFESPDESSLYHLVFSPDGRFLAASYADQKVDLWDLSAVHRRLAELNLATGLPDIFQGHTSASENPTIDRIELRVQTWLDSGCCEFDRPCGRQVFLFELIDGGLTDADQLRVRRVLGTVGSMAAGSDRLS